MRVGRGVLDILTVDGDGPSEELLSEVCVGMDVLSVSSVDIGFGRIFYSAVSEGSVHYLEGAVRGDLNAYTPDINSVEGGIGRHGIVTHLGMQAQIFVQLEDGISVGIIVQIESVLSA